MHSTQPLPSAAQLRGSRHRPPAPPPRPSAPPRCRLLASCSATAAPAPTAISCSELFLTLGSGASAVQALRGVSLSVPAGTLHMLLGRNGCGKSSLLRCCAGLVQPQAGLLTVGVPRGYVFQNPDHQVVMPSAGADVAFGLARLGLSDEEVRTRVEAALEAVGLKVSAQPSVCCGRRGGVCVLTLARGFSGIWITAGAYAERRAEAARGYRRRARRAAAGASLLDRCSVAAKSFSFVPTPHRCCCWMS